MNRNPLVSVVIPVYNVADYLEECVASLVAQTYGNIEIILVDDGSSDGSSALCDFLAREDARIRVFHMDNRGPSEARNVGVACCKGNWVSFIDSDDIVSPFFVEVMLRVAVSAGVRIASMRGVLRFYDSKNVGLLSDREVASGLSYRIVESSEALELLLYQQIDAGMVYRIYEKELLGSNPLPSGLVIGEDLVANYRLFHEAGPIALVETHRLYAYRQLPTSLVHKPCDHEKAVSAYRVATQLYEDISSWNPNLSPAAASRSFSICRTAFAQLPSEHIVNHEASCDREMLWIILRRHRLAVLCDHRARKRERLAAGVACFGRYPFSLFCKLARSFGLLR